MMRTIWVLGVVAAAVGAYVMSCSAQEAQGAKEPGLRVGVYDSRAIAVAYTSSEYQDGLMVRKSQEKKAAEEAHDAEKAERIDREMFWLQVWRHGQGFSTVGVHELLGPVKKQLPAVAREAGVDLIVSKWEIDYTGPGVKTVDVTDKLVALYAPSEKALKWATQIQDAKPMKLHEIVQHELAGGH